MYTYKKRNKVLFLGILIVAFGIGCDVPSPTTSTNSSSQTSSSSSPQIKGAGLGCEDKYCIWITGSNFSPASVIELRKPDNSSEILAKYNQLSVGTQGADQVITVAVKEEAARNALNTSGIKVRILNSQDNTYAESEVMKRSEINLEFSTYRVHKSKLR